MQKSRAFRKTWVAYWPFNNGNHYSDISAYPCLRAELRIHKSCNHGTAKDTVPVVSYGNILQKLRLINNNINRSSTKII